MARNWTTRSVAVLAIGAALVGAAADRAISRAEVNAMSAAEKNKQFRSDLISVLLPSDTLYRSNRQALQGDAWVHVKASASEFESLC